MTVSLEFQNLKLISMEHVPFTEMSEKKYMKREQKKLSTRIFYLLQTYILPNHISLYRCH